MYQKTVGDAIQKRRTKLWIRYILALVLTIVMLVMLSADYSERAVSQRIIVGWAVCLTAFILADILAGSLEGGLWAGYIYFATVVAWLILGLGGALVVVILGTSVGILARSNLSASPYVPPINDANFLETAAGRIAVTGSAVTVAALLYALFGGDAPIMDTELRVAPLAVALLVGLVVTQFVAGMLVFGDVVPKPIWEPGERGRLAAELILLLLVVPITLIFAAEDLSVLMFVIAMVGVFIQAVRYRQIHLTQDDLRARVQELSMLNAIAQNVSSNLDIENVLESIYQWVDEYATPGLFYIGLYDEDRGLIEFPLVIVGGEKAKWKTQSLEENAINNHVILNKSILKITRETRPEFETLFAGLPEDANHQVGLGIPLVVNTKIIGLIGIVSGSDWILNTGVVETVANQAGLAIRNATLYDRTVQLAENLAQINRSVQDVMFNLDSDEAMLSACKVAMDVVSAQKAAIFLLDQDVDDGLVLAQHIGLSSQHIELYSDPAYVPDLQEPLEVVVPNVDLVKEGEARIKALSEAGEFVAYAEIPLRSGNAAIGKLVVFHEQPYGYLRTQIELLESLAYQVTAALDNAELLSALEVYASEQAQLVHLSSVSTSSLDLERVIDRAAAMLQQMMSVDRITIGLLAQGNTVLQLYQDDDDDDKNVLALAEVDELAQMSAEEQTTARVYHRGDATISAGLARLMERRGDYVLAVVPMVTNNEVIGVIMLGDAIFREFSDSEWRFIEMATNQITTQIHNAQLYRETQEALHRRLQQLALLEGIAQQISRSLNLDVLIHNVLEAVIRATQAGVAAIGLYTDSGQFQLYRREWLDGELVNRDLLLTEPEGLLSEVINSSEPLIIPDNRAMAGYKTYHQKSVYRSSVIVPLLTEEGAIGVLNVESQKLDFFNDERVNFIKNLAGHATISIQNARLLQERQAQIETLTWLRDLSLGLSSNVTPDSVYGEILRTALGVVQGHSAQLWGYGPRTNELRVLASMASVDGDYVKMEIEIPAALAQQVVETGQIQLVFDVRTHPAFAGVDGWDKINYGSAIAAPIERGGSVREVLCITFKQPRPRLESEMGKIQLLAYQISGHLENLHLYDQIRSNNNRMRANKD